MWTVSRALKHTWILAPILNRKECGLSAYCGFGFASLDCAARLNESGAHAPRL